MADGFFPAYLVRERSGRLSPGATATPKRRRTFRARTRGVPCGRQLASEGGAEGDRGDPEVLSVGPDVGSGGSRWDIGTYRSGIGTVPIRTAGPTDPGLGPSRRPIRTSQSGDRDDPDAASGRTDPLLVRPGLGSRSSRYALGCIPILRQHGAIPRQHGPIPRRAPLAAPHTFSCRSRAILCTAASGWIDPRVPPDRRT